MWDAYYKNEVMRTGLPWQYEWKVNRDWVDSKRADLTGLNDGKAVSPPYPWVPHPWIQPKQIKNIPKNVTWLLTHS